MDEDENGERDDVSAELVATDVGVVRNEFVVVEAGVLAFVFVAVVVMQPFSSCVGIFSGILGT